MKQERFKLIATERVERLFQQAEEVFGTSPELSDRYVKMAWKIKSKYNLKLPKEVKRKFCRKCLSFWRPGATSRVRKARGRVVVTCLKCGRVYSFPHPKKR